MGDNDKLEIPITKLQWGLRGSQILFAFLAMCTISAVISFDNKHTSSRILDNIDLFVLILSMLFSGAIVGIPYAYLQYGKLKTVAKALRHLRIEFVLSAIWASLLFLCTAGITIEFALRKCSVSDYSQAELNNTAENRTHGEHSFEKGIGRTCSTGRASAVLGWLALLAWLGSMLLITKEWYDNRRQPLPFKHEYHPHEVTMHSNSTRSSLEQGLPPTQEFSQYKDQVQMDNLQQQLPSPALPQVPSYQPPPSNPQVGFSSPPLGPSSYPPPIPAPHASPMINPHSIQIPEPQIPHSGIVFPEPKHF
ncbi:hypothetical protein G9A89_005411 [Geosiphon pyriformis]|nr:hypothetical protein G9A89_005411 [Geosiphon pyriformis]